MSWIVSNNVGLGCFSVGFLSTKWLEHILDSSDASKFSLPLLTSVRHHLRLALSLGNLCYFKNLIARLYLQFVWVASIIITYFNTTTVLSNYMFCFFLSVSFDNNFVGLLTFCLQIFHLQTSQKKWRDTKTQSPISHAWTVVAETRESFITKLVYTPNPGITGFQYLNCHKMIMP